jgi:hypothetical protein
MPVFVSEVARHLQLSHWDDVARNLCNISTCCRALGLLARAARMDELALALATRIADSNRIFISRHRSFGNLALTGQWARAQAAWEALDAMGRSWPRRVHRPGSVEYSFALFQLWRGALREEHLAVAQQRATDGRNPYTVRQVHTLRGLWHLDQDDWKQAAASLREAVRLSRAVGLVDPACETALTLAKHHIGQLVAPQYEAERLSQLRSPQHALLARLWLALGDTAQAGHHALAAYREAWADGEPYVRRYDLTQAQRMLGQLGLEVPCLSAHDPASDEPFLWEADIRAVIRSASSIA